MTSEDLIEGTSAAWLKYLVIIIGAQWTVGIVFVEYFYYITRKLRTLSPKEKGKYMEIRNEPEKWNRLVFYLSNTFAYPIVSVFMVPRLLIFATLSLLCAIGTRLVMIGAPPNKPITGCRRTIIKFIIGTASRIGLFFLSLVWFRHIEDDSFDYSEWLGKDYKLQTPCKRPPIIVVNHQSWTVAFAA